MQSARSKAWTAVIGARGHSPGREDRESEEKVFQEVGAKVSISLAEICLCRLIGPIFK